KWTRAPRALDKTEHRTTTARERNDAPGIDDSVEVSRWSAGFRLSLRSRTRRAAGPGGGSRTGSRAADGAGRRAVTQWFGLGSGRRCARREEQESDDHQQAWRAASSGRRRSHGRLTDAALHTELPRPIATLTRR